METCSEYLMKSDFKKYREYLKEKYNMKANFQTKQFPHIEVTTTQPKSEPEDLWNDVVNFLADEYLDPNEFRWVFRGVSKAGYRLESRLDRELKSRRRAHLNGNHVDRQTAEEYLLVQFKRAAHNFIEAAMVPDNTLEWLALMQHYGAPTRLLDFTRSPYVACFFALEESDDSRRRDIKRTIWAIDATWLENSSLSRIKNLATLCDFTSDNLRDSRFMAKNYEKVFGNDRLSVILPIVPPRSNPRLLVQQGLFLCPGAPKKSFHQILSSYKDERDMQKSVHKILIDGRIRHEVLSELHFMNISRASLFPGLEGFATSLKHEVYYKSSVEISGQR